MQQTCAIEGKELLQIIKILIMEFHQYDRQDL